MFPEKLVYVDMQYILITYGIVDVYFHRVLFELKIYENCFGKKNVLANTMTTLFFFM